MNEILLNENKLECTEDILPLLIHGEEKAGASLFTVSFAANLFASGSKLLLLTGYQMAKDEFFKQTNFIGSDKIIFCLKDEVEKFINYMNTLPDIKERVIVVKNADLFDEKIFDLISGKEKIIISGDINKCVFKDKILSKRFETKVLFSKLENLEIPNLKKYQGFITESNISGMVTVRMVN